MYNIVKFQANRIPLNNDILMHQWKRVVPIPPWISKRSFICSKHFDDSSFRIINERRYLNKNAIPKTFNYSILCDIIQLQTESISSTIKSSKISTDDEPQIIPQAIIETFAGIDCEIQTSSSPMNLKDVTQISPYELVLSDMEMRLRQKEKKICSVTDLLGYLKSKGRMTKELEEALIKRFSGLKLELFQNELINTSKNKHHRRYTPILKEFASILYFYSPKTYNFVRTELNLPHKATLRKWLTEISCEAGFLSCVFDFLNNKSKK